jgi:hypothetical protein
MTVVRRAVTCHLLEVHALLLLTCQPGVEMRLFAAGLGL